VTTPVEAEAPDAPRVRPRRFTDSSLFPAVVFLGIAVVLGVVVQFSSQHMKLDAPADNSALTGTPYIGGWMQFDSGWYVYIAEHGYDAPQLAAFKAGQQSAVAYFPAYPLTVRQVARATDNTSDAAMLTTFVSGLVFALLFWRWCRGRVSSNARRVALVLVLVFPYSWFLYGSGYGDAFFLTVTISAFLLLEADRPLLAGAAGFVATAARPTGAAVFLGLVAVALERRGVVTRDDALEPSGGNWFARERSRWRVDRSKLRVRDGGVLVAIGGLATYCTYLALRFGDPFAFATVQSAPGWDQKAGPHTWFKVGFFGHLLHDQPTFSSRLVAQALFTAAFLVAAVFVGRRFGWGYGLYTLAMIGIPLVGTSDFQGMGRYLLGCFPVFAVAGEWLADRDRARRIAVVASALMLVFFASLFGRGYYLT
jgi:hypothetical protein